MILCRRACTFVDGLKGFPDAINTAFPRAQIQLCIVHMVRNSVRYYKVITTDLKQIYRPVTEEEALLVFDQFAERRDDQYSQISRSWRTLG